MIHDSHRKTLLRCPPVGRIKRVRPCLEIGCNLGSFVVCEPFTLGEPILATLFRPVFAGCPIKFALPRGRKRFHIFFFGRRFWTFRKPSGKPLESPAPRPTPPHHTLLQPHTIRLPPPPHDPPNPPIPTPTPNFQATQPTPYPHLKVKPASMHFSAIRHSTPRRRTQNKIKLDQDNDWSRPPLSKIRSTEIAFPEDFQTISEDISKIDDFQTLLRQELLLLQNITLLQMMETPCCLSQ